jgi:hypothetical protein
MLHSQHTCPAEQPIPEPLGLGRPCPPFRNLDLIVNARQILRIVLEAELLVL